MKTKRVLTTIAIASLMASVSAASDGPDELWEVTMKVETTGLPMRMGAAPRTTRVCLEKDNQEKVVPMSNHCRTTDFNRSGNKTSYSFKCTGDMEMTGSGEATIASDHASFRGSTQAKGKTEGHAFEMKQSYTGKRVGNCNLKEDREIAAALQAQGVDAKAAMAQQGGGRARLCTPKPSTYELEWPLYEKNGLCANYRGAFCDRAKEIAGKMSADPEAFIAASEKRQAWAEGMSRCGINPDKIPPPCKRAVSTEAWHFVAEHCDKETTTIAKRECAGRDYTSAMESEYRPICQKFASQNVGKNVFKETTPAAKGSPVKEQVTDRAAEKLKNGVKGMFGF